MDTRGNCEECMVLRAEGSCSKCECILCRNCFDKIHQSSKYLKTHTFDLFQCTDRSDSDQKADNERGSSVISPSFSTVSTFRSARSSPLTVANACPTHPNRSLEFYCESDKAEVCSYCIIEKRHRDHSIVTIEEWNNKEFARQCEEIESTWNILCQLLQTKEALLDKQSNVEETGGAELRRHFTSLRQALDVRERALAEDWKQRCFMESQKLNDHISILCKQRDNLAAVLVEMRSAMRQNEHHNLVDIVRRNSTLQHIDPNLFSPVTLSQLRFDNGLSVELAISRYANIDSIELDTKVGTDGLSTSLPQYSFGTLADRCALSDLCVSPSKNTVQLASFVTHKPSLVSEQSYDDGTDPGCPKADMGSKGATDAKRSNTSRAGVDDDCDHAAVLCNGLQIVTDTPVADGTKCMLPSVGLYDAGNVQQSTVPGFIVNSLPPGDTIQDHNIFSPSRPKQPLLAGIGRGLKSRVGERSQCNNSFAAIPSLGKISSGLSVSSEMSDCISPPLLSSSLATAVIGCTYDKELTSVAAVPEGQSLGVPDSALRFTGATKQQHQFSVSVNTISVDSASDMSVASQHPISDYGEEAGKESSNIEESKSIGEPDSFKQCDVIHVRSPALFMIQFKHDLPTLNTIGQTLNDHCNSSASERPATVKVDELVLAKFKDSCWYRAKVVRVRGYGEEEEVDVLFIDYGNKDTITLNEMRRMDDRLMSLPPMAHVCGLMGIAPLDCPCFTSDVIKIFYGMVAERTMFIKVLSRTDKKLCVDLRWAPCPDVTGDRLTSVIDALVALKLAVYKDPTTADAFTISPADSDQMVVARFIAPIVPRSGQSLPIIVTSVTSPSEFYVQIYNVQVGPDRKYLHEMTRELSQLYNCDVTHHYSLFLPQNGMVCAVGSQPDMGTQDDGGGEGERWFRAEVVSLTGYKEVKVKLVDIGRTVTTSVERLRKLPDSFRILPILSLHCRLDETGISFEEAMRMLSEIKERQHGKCFLTINIKDVTWEEAGPLLLVDICNIRTDRPITSSDEMDSYLSISTVSPTSHPRDPAQTSTARYSPAASKALATVVAHTAAAAMVTTVTATTAASATPMAAADSSTDEDCKPSLDTIPPKSQPSSSSFYISSSSSSSSSSSPSPSSATNRTLRLRDSPVSHPSASKSERFSDGASVSSSESTSLSSHPPVVRTGNSYRSDASPMPSIQARAMDSSRLAYSALSGRGSRKCSVGAEEITADTAKLSASFTRSCGRRPIEKPMTAEVVVSHVVSPACLYIRDASVDKMQELAKLMSDLNIVGSRHPSDALSSIDSSVQWAVGDACCARYMDKKWYRGEILEIIDTQAQVFIGDYGYTHLVNLSELRVLDRRHRSIPSCAVRCHLADICPISRSSSPGSAGGYSSEACRFLRAFLNKNTLYAAPKVDVKEDEEGVISQPLDLVYPELIRGTALSQDRVVYHSISADMVDAGLAVFTVTAAAARSWSGDSSGTQAAATTATASQATATAAAGVASGKATAAAGTTEATGATAGAAQLDNRVPFPPLIFPNGCHDYPPPLAPSSSILKVTVTHVDLDGSICVQKVPESAELRSLESRMLKLNAHYSVTPVLPAAVTWAIGEPVAARFSDDKLFYRARITSIEPLVRFKVLFVDYGNSEIVERQALRKMIPEFLQLPLECYTCTLFGIKMLSRLSASSATKILKWTEAATTVMTSVISIMAVRSGMKLEVKFTLPDKRDFAQLLCQENYARFTSDADHDGRETCEGPTVEQTVPSPYRQMSLPAVNDVLYIQVTHVDSVDTVYVQDIKMEAQNDLNLNHRNLQQRVVNPQEELITLNERYQVEAERYPLLHDSMIVPGTACVAQFVDRCWYRAEVVCVIYSDYNRTEVVKAGIRFIDYGSWQYNSPSKLRQISPDDLVLPALCRRCQLDGVQAPEVDEVDLMTIIKNLLLFINLIAVVKSIEDETIKVDLFSLSEYMSCGVGAKTVYHDLFNKTGSESECSGGGIRGASEGGGGESIATNTGAGGGGQMGGKSEASGIDGVAGERLEASNAGAGDGRIGGGEVGERSGATNARAGGDGIWGEKSEAGALGTSGGGAGKNGENGVGERLVGVGRGNWLSGIRVTLEAGGKKVDVTASNLLDENAQDELY